MALAAQNSVSSLMRKTLDRQAAAARMKLRFKKCQVEEILISYVKNAKIGPYNELVKVLKEYPLNDENFKILLEDCIFCVVILGRELKMFVEVMCNIEWSSRSPDLVELYCRFLLSLVTAHTYHCPQVMTSLVKLFKAEYGENWNENSPETALVKKWSHIHAVIAQIIAIMPMTSDLLMQTVIDNFPYYKASCYTNRAYVHNLIWIAKYIPSLQEQILIAIVSRMVIMDVNIVDQIKNQNETMFEMDVDTHDDVSQSLDYCLLEVLQWLEDEKDPMLNIMCNVFERIILPTHGIRHVQFLILYTISISQQCADRVLNNLWVVAAGLHGLGPGALATRRTAASHLAGLLARCLRVPNSRIVHYLRSMSDWCHSYITATQESSSSSDNTKVHGAFHAICHAIFYLVAFKSQLLFSTKENLNFIESLNLTRLVTCNLNPLKTCPPQVTRAFSSVTRSHQVVYCQAIIEKNTRLTLQSAALEYDDWFPYDPYSLPISGKKIWPLCIEYKDWGKSYDEDQFSHMKRKRDDDDDYLLSHSPHKIACNLSNCISPGFKNSDSVTLL